MHGLDKIILDFGASHVSVSIFPWEWDSDICIHVGTVDSFDQIVERCAINMMNSVKPAYYRFESHNIHFFI